MRIKKVLGLDDIHAFLCGMPMIYQKAIIFAMYSDKSFEEVEMLKWSDDSSDLSWQAVDVLTPMPINIKSDYVFWGYDDCKQVMPICNLKIYFDLVSVGMPWEEFVRTYKGAIPIDFESDYDINHLAVLQNH